jgi:predicted Zn-dependent protease
MASMFEKLAEANRLNDSGSFPYLRSHPLTAERISEARDRAAGQPPLAAPPLLHGLMAARAQVLMDPTTATLRRWQSPQAARADEPAVVAAYRQTLVAAGLRDEPALQQALATLQRAAEGLDGAPRQVVRLGAAEALLAVGRADAALAWLDADDPGRPAQLLRAQVHRRAFADGDPRRAAALKADLEALQARVSETPSDFVAWRELGQTAAAAGQPLRALRAGAEAAYAAGDLQGAVERLRAAQRSGLAGEPFEAQIVEARLRTLEAQRREQLAQARERSR